VCDCVWECSTTLNSERKRARGDRYAPVCSRWLTKRLVKRLLTAAVTAAASVGGRRPPIGGRSRPTGDDLLPPAIRPFAYARTHVYDVTGLSLPAATSPPQPAPSTPHTSRSDTTSQNDHTARAIASTASRTVNNHVLSAAFLHRRQASPHRNIISLPNRSYFCRASFSLSSARPRRFAPRGSTYIL